MDSGQLQQEPQFSGPRGPTAAWAVGRLLQELGRLCSSSAWAGMAVTVLAAGCGFSDSPRADAVPAMDVDSAIVDTVQARPPQDAANELSDPGPDAVDTGTVDLSVETSTTDSAGETTELLEDVDGPDGAELDAALGDAAPNDANTDSEVGPLPDAGNPIDADASQALALSTCVSVTGSAKFLADTNGVAFHAGSTGLEWVGLSGVPTKVTWTDQNAEVWTIAWLGNGFGVGGVRTTDNLPFLARVQKNGTAVVANPVPGDTFWDNAAIPGFYPSYSFAIAGDDSVAYVTTWPLDGARLLAKFDKKWKVLWTAVLSEVPNIVGYPNLVVMPSELVQRNDGTVVAITRCGTVQPLSKCLHAFDSGGNLLWKTYATPGKSVGGMGFSKIAAIPDGSFVVVSESYEQNWIVQTIDANGGPQPAVVLAFAPGLSNLYSDSLESVTGPADGAFDVVFSGKDATGTVAFSLQRLLVNGTPVGSGSFPTYFSAMAAVKGTSKTAVAVLDPQTKKWVMTLWDGKTLKCW